MLRRLADDSGFSFIELILTTFLLSVGLAGGVVLMQNTVSNSVYGDYNVIASQLANEKLETIIADKTFQGYDAVEPDNYPSENLADPYVGFQRSVDINEVSTADLTTPEVGSGYKRVNVTVTWGDEDYQNITVGTLLTDYAP